MNGIVFEYQGDDYLYIDEDKKEHWLFSVGYTTRFMWLDTFLNANIEVIEEPKKIEQIKGILRIDDLETCTFNEQRMWENIIIQQNKINELIDHINKLEKESE